MTEFKEGSWNPDDIKDVKDLTRWCKVQDGVIEKGVCMTHGSELAFDNRITIKMPYGDHIPLKDKTGNKGRTKNIEYIGARNVFGVDYDTAEVDYDAITQDKIEDAWKDDLDLFIGQGRDQQWIDRVFELGKIAGVPHIDKKLTIREKIFNEAFPVLKPYPLNREIPEYIVDRKTGKRTRI